MSAVSVHASCKLPLRSNASESSAQSKCNTRPARHVIQDHRCVLQPPVSFFVPQLVVSLPLYPTTCGPPSSKRRRDTPRTTDTALGSALRVRGAGERYERHALHRRLEARWIRAEYAVYSRVMAWDAHRRMLRGRLLDAAGERRDGTSGWCMRVYINAEDTANRLWCCAHARDETSWVSDCVYYS